jgi:hypothetical protein
MNNNTLIKPKGVYWNELSNAEKTDIKNQLKFIERDPNYTTYRYYKTRFHKWIICNAFSVPMKTSKAIL